MTFSDDDIGALEHLLGPDLTALLDELDAVADDIDALASVPDDEKTRARRAELERHRRTLHTDAGACLQALRRRLGLGLSPRDERTMPLPFVDLGVR